jgi:hypothetical protein
LNGYGDNGQRSFKVLQLVGVTLFVFVTGGTTISVLSYKRTMRWRTGLQIIPNIQWFPLEEEKTHKIIHVFS